MRTNVSWSLEKDCNILAHPQISQLGDQFKPQCLDTDEDTLIFMQLHISWGEVIHSSELDGIINRPTHTVLSHRQKTTPAPRQQLEQLL